MVVRKENTSLQKIDPNKQIKNKKITKTSIRFMGPQ
jgi:hypothetical protein